MATPKFLRRMQCVSTLYCIQTILQNSAKELNAISGTPKLDVEILVAHVLNVSRSFLYSHNEKILTTKELETFQDFFSRRKSGEPIAYIIGKKEFWSLELEVNKNVLIPRPDTELLVEICLEKLAKNKKLSVVDLGTGSGAIAIALAKERPNWHITATDISKRSLQIAQKNAAKFALKNIIFCHGSWYHALPQKKYNAVISNPPYISLSDKYLKKGDVRFEPQKALVSGKTGLKDFHVIIKSAATYLTKNGLIMLECGFDQASQVKDILQKNNFKNIQSFKDLAGHERVVSGVVS
jgi:release factor glutamine methyltransferase